MERDFLGIGGQSPGALMKERRVGLVDSAISIGSAAPRHFSNKASALQQFVSIQPVASVDAYEASRKACGFQAPKKSLGVERHSVMQFGTQAYQNQGADVYRTSQLNDARFATVPHSSTPIAMTSPFLKSHGSSNGPNPTATAVKQHLGSVVPSSIPSVKLGVGTLSTRKVQKPPRKRAQLTIFYAGSVNVYEDVPCDMVKAIMLMASKECKPAANAVHQSPEASALSFSKGKVSDDLSVTSQILSNNTTSDQAVHQFSGLSCTVSIASHAESGNGPAVTNDKVAANSTLAQISTSHNESSRTISMSLGTVTANNLLSKAVPQARKASLARFLEKRKERVSNMMPYSCEKKPSNNSNVLDDGTPSSKCSSADISIQSNHGGSWCVGQTKGCNGNDYYPSIKFEM